MDGETQHLFVEGPYHLIGMTVYLHEVIVPRFDILAVRGYIDVSVRSGLYLSRIRTYFYLLDFGKRRDVDHRDRTVYPDAFPVQASGVGDIQLPVLHTNAVGIPACPGQCIDREGSGIYPRNGSVKGAYVCFSSLEGDVTGLPRTAVLR